MMENGLDWNVALERNPFFLAPRSWPQFKAETFTEIRDVSALNRFGDPLINPQGDWKEKKKEKIFI